MSSIHVEAKNIRSVINRCAYGLCREAVFLDAAVGLIRSRVRRREEQLGREALASEIEHEARAVSPQDLIDWLAKRDPEAPT